MSPPTYTVQPAIMSTAASLPQLAAQVPGFLKQVNIRSDDSTPLDLDPVDEFFDVGYYFRDVTRKHRGSESSRSSSSNPGLTSAGSVEDGSPSPSPSEDSFPFEDFDQVRKQDDQFTVPQRELRPNGPIPYPVLMHLDSDPNHHPVDFHSHEAKLAHSTMSSVPSSRGKRLGPLLNSEKTAAVRLNEACIPCRSRKVACDLGTVCSNCIVAAEKRSSQGGFWDPHELCFRERDILPGHANVNIVFQAIREVESSWSFPLPRHDQPVSLISLGLRFDPMTEATFPIPVAMQAYDGYSYTGGSLPVYTLRADSMPAEEHLLGWAKYQLYQEQHPHSFQSTLDILMLERVKAGSRSSQHFELLRMVTDIRCWYRIWRQEKFFCVTQGNIMVEELPNSVHLGLRRIVNAGMQRLEQSFMKAITKAIVPASKLSEDGRLSLWLSLLQLILTYRDILGLMGSSSLAASYSAGCEQELFQGSLEIQRVAAGQLSKTMVIFETLFSKKKPSGLPAGISGDKATAEFNQLFEKVSCLKDQFCQQIYHSMDPIDQRLACLLGINSSRRRGTRTEGRQTNKGRSSRRC